MDTAVVDTANVDFMPNAARSIVIEGRLDKALLERLRPQIVDLVSASRAPITLFINSTGGDASIAHCLVSLLKFPDSAGNSARIITVGCGRVFSAATSLLAAGDLAIVHPECQLLYHGSGHHQAPGRLTAELTAALTDSTKSTDEWRAASFARTCLRRGMFIISALRSEFSELQQNRPRLTDLECFQRSLISRLSPAGKRVVRRARGMSSRSDALISCWKQQIAAGRPTGIVALERAALDASVAFEKKRRHRLLSAGGLSRIAQHFFFLRQFVAEECGETLADVAGDRVTEESTYFLPFLPFLLSVYRALSKGENDLTPSDAVWLGLVDTVRNAAMSESPKCPWCSRDFGSWPAAKIHVKNCAAAPRPRWAEHRKRSSAHGC
jgi:ATP-dependent protease ClpP protease subunit